MQATGNQVRPLLSRDLQEVHLTRKEFAVLAELARHPGPVVTHSQLLKAAWGVADTDDVEYLRVAVRGLRQKIEADQSWPRLLTNDPGIGYRLNVE